MHSLVANASLAGRVSVAFQDIIGVRISPNINVANNKSNTRFGQFKETFDPLRLAKFR